MDDDEGTIEYVCIPESLDLVVSGSVVWPPLAWAKEEKY